MIHDPRKDGITHINVYSKAHTMLGRFLSNFAKSPFEHPKYGHFTSIEGLWYWLTVKDDRLRRLYGIQAKQLGRELRGAESRWDLEFKEDILLGIKAKLETNPSMLEALRCTKLPLVHYYVMSGGIIDKTKDVQWILDYFESLRGRKS